MADTAAFLGTLFAGVPGLMTFAAMKGDCHRFRHIPTQRADLIAQATADLLTANAAGCSTVLGIATRRPGLDRYHLGGLQDLHALPALYADIDDPTDLDAHLANSTLPTPSAWINSGRGVHLYWFLDTPLTNSPVGDFRKAFRVMKWIARRLDGCSFNITQPMRLPGSINPKHDRLCEIVDMPAYRYSFAHLASYVPSPTQRTPSQTAATAETIRRAIADALISAYNGQIKTNGYIAAECPFGHTHDRAGSHFNYNPRTGNAHCFGRHGRISSEQLATVLNIRLD